MANRPRRHHYVPAFYLSGFTDGGGRDDRLFVFDQGAIKSWAATPDNAGHQRDFYAVDLGPNVDPASFESDVLAPLEGDFSGVVRTIFEVESLPDGDDFDTLLNLVAVMAARTPRTRQLVGQVTDMTMKFVVKNAVSTEEGWKEFRACCEEVNGPLTDSYAEELRKFILSAEYDINIDQTSHVQKIVELVDGMLPVIGQRHWSLGIADPCAPDFVCTDVPVSLTPTDKFGPDDELHLASRNTLLAMPLNRRTVLFGSYEVRPPKLLINELGVLSVNALTITEARQVFSAEQDFLYLGSDKRPKRRVDLEDSLRRREGKYSHLNEMTAGWFQSRFGKGNG